MKKFGVRKSVQFLAFGVALLYMVVITQSVMADTLLWSSGVPATASKKDAPLDYSWIDQCQSKFNSMKMAVTLDGTDNTNPQKTDCLVGEGANFKLLSYSNARVLAVQFGDDSKAYTISGIDCERCVYMPSRDMLISLESNNQIRSGRIAIYKNFVSKLKLKNTLTLNQKYYEFAQAEPDQLIGDFYGSNGYTDYLKAIQRSSNDKWLLVEFVGDGLFRVDMDTMQMLKFSDFRSAYWSSNPSVEYDITEDGQHIAVFGHDTPNEIYDITPGCGTIMPITANSSQLYQQIQSPCPALAVASPKGEAANNTYVPYMKDTFQPHFNGDGSEITFYATSYDNAITPRKITLRAANYSGQQSLDYLALGDSYSSGEGDTEKTPTGGKYYRAFTDNNENKSATIPAERCHVSTRSYPYKLAAGMNLSISGPKKWDTVACSGATIWDVKSEGSTDYGGQWNRLKGYNVDALKAQALNEMIPGRQKQIEFVKKYQPKVITLTMGGNDVGFADKVRNCLTQSGSCDFVTDKRAELSSEIVNQFKKLKNLYEEIYFASGGKTKIYVIGYPNFISADQTVKCDLNVGLLNYDERNLISSSVTYLNNVIKQAAIAAGVKYIDIENSLNGHRLCDSEEKYVTGINDPLNWSNNLQESFHPNAKGNQSIALAIWSGHNMNSVSLLDYDGCPLSEENLCPDASATQDKITVPAYFSSVNSSRNIQNKRMTSPDQQINSPLNIAMDNFTLLPGTKVKVVLHSDPINLGEYNVADDGSVNITTSIPATMTPGFHTVILSGETYSGNAIEYEQSILLKSSNANDIDGDGIIDTQDRCLYVPSSDKDYDGDGIDDACDSIIGDAPITSSPSSTTSSIPKPSSISTPSVVTVVKQVVNTIVATVSLLVGLLTKLLLRL